MLNKYIHGFWNFIDRDFVPLQLSYNPVVVKYSYVTYDVWAEGDGRERNLQGMCKSVKTHINDVAAS
jgi:hypothetical protein